MNRRCSCSVFSAGRHRNLAVLSPPASCQVLMLQSDVSLNQSETHLNLFETSLNFHETSISQLETIESPLNLLQISLNLPKSSLNLSKPSLNLPDTVWLLLSQPNMAPELPQLTHTDSKLSANTRRLSCLAESCSQQLCSGHLR